MSIFSQERLAKKGLVYHNNEPLINCKIINRTAANTTVYSNANGFFEIVVTLNDTLQYIYSNELVKTQVITAKVIDKEWLEVNITKGINMLDEVILSHRTDINAVSLGISKPGIMQPTVFERRLLTAGDFKPIHLLGLLGGSLEIDPIINAISGRTKKLKKLVAFEKVAEAVKFLENKYSLFMVSKFKIDQAKATSFFVYVAEESYLKNLISEENDSAIKFYLIDKFAVFKSFGN
jgi:hypothetical protein